MHLRKIRSNELRDVAAVMAECFTDYPLYGAFFNEDKWKTKKVFYFFWYRLYTRQSYTLISEDHSIVLSMKRPEDKECSPIGLLLNPLFSIGFIFINKLKCLKDISDFSKMEEKWQEKFYDAETDNFVQALCIKPEFRAHGSFFNLVKEMDSGGGVYFETHDEKLLRLYRFMGAKLLVTDEWRGVKHYVLKRDKVK